MDLRGYGDSDKPNGRDAYKMDKLVDDVRQIIDILGMFFFFFTNHLNLQKKRKKKIAEM